VIIFFWLRNRKQNVSPADDEESEGQEEATIQESSQS
jgi:hypothetical protein